MATASRVTVTDTATALVEPGPSGRRLLLLNLSEDVDLDVGGADVETEAGFPLPAAGTLSVQLAPGETLWAVADESDTASVAVLVT